MSFSAGPNLKTLPIGETSDGRPSPRFPGHGPSGPCRGRLRQAVLRISRQKHSKNLAKLNPRHGGLVWQNGLGLSELTLCGTAEGGPSPLSGVPGSFLSSMYRIMVYMCRPTRKQGINTESKAEAMQQGWPGMPRLVKPTQR